jgi:hypothetical protein
MLAKTRIRNTNLVIKQSDLQKLLTRKDVVSWQNVGFRVCDISGKICHQIGDGRPLGRGVAPSASEYDIAETTTPNERTCAPSYSMLPP